MRIPSSKTITSLPHTHFQHRNPDDTSTDTCPQIYNIHQIRMLCFLFGKDLDIVSDLELLCGELVGTPGLVFDEEDGV